MKTFLRMALPLALLIAAPLQAQTTLGVKGGINIATVDTNVSDISDLVDSKTGFVGGGFVTLGLGSLFALQPELLYSQKGFQVDEFGETVKFNTNYIEIPVLLPDQLQQHALGVLARELLVELHRLLELLVSPPHLVTMKQSFRRPFAARIWPTFFSLFPLP